MRAVNHCWSGLHREEEAKDSLEREKRNSHSQERDFQEQLMSKSTELEKKEQACKQLRAMQESDGEELENLRRQNEAVQQEVLKVRQDLEKIRADKIVCERQLKAAQVKKQETLRAQRDAQLCQKRLDRVLATWLSAGVRQAQMAGLMDRVISEKVSVLTEADLHAHGVHKDIEAVLKECVSKRSDMMGLSLQFVRKFGDANGLEVSGEVVLDRSSPEFQVIERLFQDSLVTHRLEYRSDVWCQAASLQVSRVVMLDVTQERCDQYRKECDRVGKKGLHELPFALPSCTQRPLAETDSNEAFLFHGCPWKSVEGIKGKGFAWSRGGENTGVMFGKGVYFAPHASKCDFYAEDNANGEKCMFLARVVLGSAQPRWRRCTEVKNVGSYQSIVAATRDAKGCVDHPEMVIFQKCQALPVFQIEYKHAESCACNLCERGRLADA